MRERICTFGPEQSLTGVLTEPDPTKVLPGAPAVVLSNVGLNHHVGPYRLWVELARLLAARGITTLRFDLSGLGDSRPRREGGPDEFARAREETRAALDYLEQKKGQRDFALIGLCSGVDSVHSVAVQDPRVVGAAFIDGYTYRTVGYHLRFQLRYLSPRRWTRFLRKRKLPSQLREAGEADEVYTREYPEQARLTEDYAKLLERGVNLCFVFSGGMGLSFNYERQFYEMFSPLKLEHRVTYAFYPRADHLFSVPEDRAELLRKLTAWAVGIVPPKALAG
ncbi:alpha/beta fold hydrolase [Corallococcus terminator]|uniref:Alpha/beta fold hydrolase n=1 Tax=Corallococcus terminator TaxID=2316733 RepID=A0A3A8JN47_9BACT|nr:alpha/beta fold hydrolase [Corallococcus terminator]RKG90933.1 alpha/beta fold hydrolase [Corallococcus terminator]